MRFVFNKGDRLKETLRRVWPDLSVHVARNGAGYSFVCEGDVPERDVREVIERQGVKKYTLVVAPHHKAPPAKKPSKIVVTGVKKIIVVASGKGGVGKSTVAANLACALAKQGLQVGLLDADIYGPSLPKLMGLEGQKPAQNEHGKIMPLTAHNVRVISIGFMVDAAQALIWRGPMVQSAFKQLLSDVDWQGCDILILDTPPGTGDVQLTLAQSLDVDGAIIVSTPQELALADARKGIQMFQKLNVPILGLLENMSGNVFGTGGVEKEAVKQNVPFLGSIPLEAAIREAGDAGQPVEKIFETLAERVRTALDKDHDQNAA